MPRINLQLFISAPHQRVFNLARSVEVHVASTKHTGERVVGGRMSGLFQLGDTVTWRAKHFGVWQELTSRITEMQPYSCFVDEMVKGAFHSFRHEHRFSAIDDNNMLMDDVFEYQSPLGFLGILADKLFLQQYMTNLLQQRNECIKAVAEGKDWQRFVQE
ncbi:hypothetical protein BH09BAC1_BH09BAC1_19810 [soil metagenome]